MQLCLSRALTITVALTMIRCGAPDAPRVERPVPPGSRVLLHFEGTVDAEAGTLTFSSMQTIAQGMNPVPVVQDGIPNVGPPDTIELVTNWTAFDCSGSTAPSFCGGVTIRSFFTNPLENVYAEITTIVPASGCDGQNSVAPGTTGLSNTFGLWSYDPIAPGGSDQEDWHFNNFCSGNFTFRGRVMANENPTATPDSYAGTNGAIGNTELSVPAATGVLRNDSDPSPGTGLTAVVVTNGATTNGGTFDMASTGAFLFRPRAGDSATDTFTYTVVDQFGGTDVGTVTIEVTDMVWYVDGNAAPGGNGTDTAPFDTLTGAATASGPNEIIYVFDDGAASTSAGITLQAGQQLIGEGVDLNVNGRLLQPAGTAPDLTSPVGAVAIVNGVADVTIAGVNIAGAGGPGIHIISGQGTIAVTEVNISDTAGPGIDIDAANIVRIQLGGISWSSPSDTFAVRATSVFDLSIEGTSSSPYTIANVGTGANDIVGGDQGPHAIFVSSSRTVTLDFVHIDVVGESTTQEEEDAIYLLDCTGAITVTNLRVQDYVDGDALHIRNTVSSANTMTITDNTFGPCTARFPQDGTAGVRLEVDGAARAIDAVIERNRIIHQGQNDAGAGIAVQVTNGDGVIGTGVGVTIANNTITDREGDNISIIASEGGAIRALVDTNTLTADTDSLAPIGATNAIQVDSVGSPAGPQANVHALLRNNAIAGFAGSGTFNEPILVQQIGSSPAAPKLTVQISDHAALSHPGDHAIRLRGAGDGNLNATVTNNVVTGPRGFNMEFAGAATTIAGLNLVSNTAPDFLIDRGSVGPAVLELECNGCPEIGNGHTNAAVIQSVVNGNGNVGTVSPFGTNPFNVVGAGWVSLPLAP